MGKQVVWPGCVRATDGCGAARGAPGRGRPAARSAPSAMGGASPHRRRLKLVEQALTTHHGPEKSRGPDQRNAGGVGSTSSSSNSSGSAGRLISMDEVREHRTAETCWVAVAGRVYDVTGFLNDHPGGAGIVLDHAGVPSYICAPLSAMLTPLCSVPPPLRVTGVNLCVLHGVAGRDATAIFERVHAPSVLRKWGTPFLIGRVDDGRTAGPAGAAEPREEPHAVAASGLLSPPLPSRALVPVALSSPFPHGRFESLGLEAIRFEWALHDRMTAPGVRSHTAGNIRNHSGRGGGVPPTATPRRSVPFLPVMMGRMLLITTQH
jgi:cytochrome b involved in lipid metabolism